MDANNSSQSEQNNIKLREERSINNAMCNFFIRITSRLETSSMRNIVHAFYHPTEHLRLNTLTMTIRFLLMRKDQGRSRSARIMETMVSSGVDCLTDWPADRERLLSQ